MSTVPETQYNHNVYPHELAVTPHQLASFAGDPNAPPSGEDNCRPEAPEQCGLEGGSLRQSAMRIEIPAKGSPSTETTDGYFRLRPWQERCFNKLANARNSIINAPTAAGKTLEICAIAADRLKKDPHLRVVISVPQTNIAAGYRRNLIEMPDGSRVNWEVNPKLDLCADDVLGCTTRLLSFLEGSFDQAIMNRAVLCTHATLVRAFGTDATGFDNVLIIIDEAHHVKHGMDEVLETELDNQLGALVRYSLAHADRIQLGLTTATLFRGDRAQIIPDMSKFVKYELSFEEYFESCRFLRSISYDFVLYGPSVVDALKNLFDQKIGKTIVYIPPVNSSSSVGNKKDDVACVLRAIAGTDEPIISGEGEPIMRVKRGEQWINVVNLVDETNRDKKSAAVVEAHKASDPGRIDVVIALGMLKEGSNWRWADREIIIGHRGSLTEIIQMNGRLFRDVEGKSHVEIYQLLPFAPDQNDKSRTRQALNDYLASILLSMLLENVLSPVPARTPKQDTVRGGGGCRVDYLREACSDAAQASAVLEDINRGMWDAAASGAGALPREAYREMVSRVLSAHGIAEHHDEIADQIWRMFSRRAAAMAGLNFGQIDINLIRENPFGCLLQYTSDACGINTFRELRAICRPRAYRDFEEARKYARSLNLNSMREWREYCVSGEKPEDIPTNAPAVYQGHGWVSFGDWLGTGRTWTRQSRAFVEARQFVRSLRFRSQAEWLQYCRSGLKPPDIPTCPEKVYKRHGWTSIGDWLGTHVVSTSARVYRSHSEAREFVHSLRLRNQGAWRAYCKSGKKPVDIPQNPSLVYQSSGWAGFGDWLGTGTIATFDKVYRPFHEARDYVRDLRLESVKEWHKYCRSGQKPNDIPSSPDRTYEDQGWQGFGDWLGTGRIANGKKTYRSFSEARRFVRNLQLCSSEEWRKYRRSGNKPDDIPANPNTVYRDEGWLGIGDWLGTGRVAPKNKAFRPYNEARDFVRSLGLNSVKE